jgi:hypothetical protein
MAIHRWAIGPPVTALVLLAASALAGPAVGAPTTGTVSTAAVTANAQSPCVHRGITFFCGRVSGGLISPPVATYLQFSFGDPTDLPVFGDWNGDGNRTAAVFRPATATWYLTNTNDASDPPQVLFYGSPGDIPLSGNWVGFTDPETVGVYRPSNATFYLHFTHTSGAADVTIPFGNRGDIPLAGDFDITGTTRIGVYRPANQTFYFTHGDSSPFGSVSSVVFGIPGDRPLAGSYQCGAAGNALHKVFAVFRPANVTWYGLCAPGAMSATNVNFQYGNPNDVPLLK